MTDSTARQRVLLDCDPGIDDALALVYLAALQHAGEVSLEGVTTSAGNVEAHLTAANARWVLDMCGLDEVPVLPGCATPRDVELVTTPETHGPAGLGYAHAPAVPGWSDERSASASGDTWRELWRGALVAGNTHLIITGPLTNTAAFQDTDADALERAASRTVMGGAVNYRGNTTPTAEWNFWVDPHAARDYFAAAPSSPLTTLCSLQVTEQFLIDPQRLEGITALLGNRPIARVLPEMLRFYFEFHQEQGEGYQAQIHDLLTCMIALGKIPFTATSTRVAVEADSPLLRGTSVADLRGHWGLPDNTSLVTGVDIPGAHAEFARALRAAAATGWGG